MQKDSSSLILSSSFRKMTPQKRLDYLWQHIPNTVQDSLTAQNFIQPNHTITKFANAMVESAVGIMSIPIGIVSNLLVNNTYYHVPIATEEPSVCAGASFGAKIIGDIHAKSTYALQDAQIALTSVTAKGEKNLQKALPEITTALMSKMKNMHARGGGVRSVSYYKKHPDIFVILATFNTCDVMGANTVNSAVESIVPLVKKISGGTFLSAILSNFTDSRLARATCHIPLKNISSNEKTAKTIALKIEKMCVWAQNDIRRAVTHNKGIMNGITGLALSTGNDTRAIEAASHAWASAGTTYQPLSTFIYNDKTKELAGSLEIPALLASVGGSTNHPVSQWTRAVLNINRKKTLHAHTLNCIGASLGLAQNFAALFALVTEGIQKGHMKLHAKKQDLTTH